MTEQIPQNTVGFDIGGANLKAADAGGHAVSRPFPVWREPQHLAGEIRSMLQEFAPPRIVAVTMTAELADCFETKAEGVRQILRSVEQACAPLESFGRAPAVHVWQTGAEFVTPDVAAEIPLLVAAANWHALATWIGRLVPAGAALMIDIGSTTTDIVPLEDGVPSPHGLTDLDRMLAGELVYTGVRRTPLCAVASTVPLRGMDCPLAAELFATMLDVYLLLGLRPPNPDDIGTANGRPATQAAALDRLVRMLCCDRTEISLTEALDIAQYLTNRQQEQIARAIDRVVAAMTASPDHVLLSGSGTCLAEQIAAAHPLLTSARITKLDDLFDSKLATSACAFAVARLAQERVLD